MVYLSIRPVATADRPWLSDTFMQHWGSTRMVSRGVLHQVDKLPGFLALLDEEKAGIVCYQPAIDEAEIVMLHALIPRLGIGKRLLEKMISLGRVKKWRRLWLITTNDNVTAQNFYAACGWQLKHIHPNALQASRKLKPEIPLLGLNGLPINDEYEYEFQIG